MLRKSWTRDDPCAQRDRIDEVADEPRPFSATAPGGGRANEEIALTRVTIEQHLKRREQSHVKRRAARTAQLAQCTRQLFIDHYQLRLAAERLLGGMRIVARQIQCRRFA